MQLFPAAPAGANGAVQVEPVEAAPKGEPAGNEKPQLTVELDSFVIVRGRVAVMPSEIVPKSRVVGESKKVF